LRQDRYDEAVKEFRAALSLDSTLTLRARFPLAVALFEMKKFDEARQEFEAVRREVGDHPNVCITWEEWIWRSANSKAQSEI